MRKIERIVIHCTATSPDAKIKNILKYWKEKKDWKNPGYHFIIPKSGFAQKLLSIDKIANGAKGYNNSSIHIGYVGGVNKNKEATDTRTKAQEETLFNLIIELHEKFPKAEILGHKDLPNVRKSCPSFNVKKWLADYMPDLGTFEINEDLF